MPKDYNPYYQGTKVGFGQDAAAAMQLTRDKWLVIGAALFGVAVWGGAGLVLGGWNGMLLCVCCLAVIASFCHSLGSVWTYLRTPGLSPDVRGGLSRYANEFYPNGKAPDGGEGFVDVILRDWLIGHGYLQVPPELDD